MATDPRYPYVAVDVARADADDAGSLLFELGARGVEERDATTLVRGAHRAGGDGVTLVASFDTREQARTCLEELPQAWSPRLEEIVGDEWRDEWKKHFEPFRLCAGIVVSPPWRAYEASAGESVLVLEPGRAFGTGLHETTSLVAVLLAERAALLAGSAVLDVGCGSGILALVALKLGAARAHAIDVDPEAVLVTRENAQRNGVSDRVETGDVLAGTGGGNYPMVVANIEHATLVDLAIDLVARVAPGGLLILSGLLAPAVAPRQLADIRERYAPLAIEEVRQKGEWIAVVLRR
jgi:ribosomal protein L11 methyltransferase